MLIETKRLDEIRLPLEHAERLVLGGHVQGVGFRPFVYRLAHRHRLTGWIRNEMGHVRIVVQGPLASLQAFFQDLIQSPPPLAKPLILERSPIALRSLNHFFIKSSLESQQAHVQVPPDQFMCDDCMRELLDRNDRRYHYPFINCTQCGPRYTLINQLPYDRSNTTMAEFELCPACKQEYINPLDRRFHAEPTACPDCGPQLTYTDADVGFIQGSIAAMAETVKTLHQGKTVAVKGIGGYHLLCAAEDDTAVQHLRKNKHRPDKPLAVMFPIRGDDGLDEVRHAVDLSFIEARMLTHPTRAIVLANKLLSSTISTDVAPGLKQLGVFLPYSPLHHLLLQSFGRPLVATSGNISGEPVLTDNNEASDRLATIADAFLHHNRTIERPADDAVYRVIAEQSQPLRIGRGTAPLELTLPFTLPNPLLAVGGHMKNTVALAWDNRVVVSPHIGDLDSPRSMKVFQQVIEDLQSLYHVRAQHIVCDAHPDYASRRWAHGTSLPVTAVFHHHAHASTVAGEYAHVDKSWLVFTWDGVGYGTDGTLWGGEAFLGKPGQWQRAASFKPFHLPGGSKASREPWRSAAALCWQTGYHWPELLADTELLHQAWIKHINCPASTAVGRLFDAAAALTGLSSHASFEGQAPMLLENQVTTNVEPCVMPLTKNPTGLWQTDWTPLLPMLLDKTQSISQRAACFHSSMAHGLLAQARMLRKEHGEFAVGLSGGVFQNKILTEQVMQLLSNADFSVYICQNLPSNDGGLCFGQIIEAGYVSQNQRH